MRKPIIAGNWKMNNTPSQAVELIEAIKPLVKDAKCDVVVCPTFVCLDAASKALAGSNIGLGAQNVHFEEKGAFTGEISTGMLNELDVKYAVIGHSERRQYFGETDEVVAKRSLAAINAGITPIICVGELLEERQNGTTFDVVKTQTVKALELMSAEQVAASVIAYEPVWAIGTGLTATSEQAEEVIAFIRNTVKDMFDAQTAENIRIQYGGSMNAKNAAELMAMPNIDGGLIGGASLKAPDFAAIVEAASKEA